MRRLATILALMAVAIITACEFDRAVIPVGRSRPVVHAVLNPFVRPNFYLLLERTLSGRVETTQGAFDRDDQVVSSGGDPLSGARVVIYNATRTDSGVAYEASERSGNGKGRGMYVFENVGCGLFYCPLHGIMLLRGGTYSLDILTPTGERLSSTTTIPVAGARPDTGLSRTFNWKTDTYVFSWQPAEGFGRYVVQIQTPYGPFQAFSDVESLAVNGTLRNFQHERFPRVFVPGFKQPFLASAVDLPYYNYYRSENNIFTGQGLVSNITGGVGLFGSYHQIRYQDIDVVAPFDEPADGEWRRLGDTSANFPARLTLWADGTFVSGKLVDFFDEELQTRRGVIGIRRSSGIEVQVLFGQSLRDTAWSMMLDYRGDTLVTTSPEKGEQRWVRIPTS